jgi:hypothetical protein
MAGSVTVVDPGSGDSTRRDSERFEALRLQFQALRLLSAETNARARATRDQIRRGRAQREILHDSAFARLQAKMGTMPVIEQAKGIIMAQRGCGPEEAFDLLRQASQRSNIKVHQLAEQLVKAIASSNNGGNVTPLTRGARWDLRP